MEERGVFVDHSSINCGAIRFLPLLEKVFRKYRDPVGGSWCIDETYIKVKCYWKYLCRAVDKEGKTVDFLLTAKRGQARGRLQPCRAWPSAGTPGEAAPVARLMQIGISAEIDRLQHEIRQVGTQIHAKSATPAAVSMPPPTLLI